MEQNGQQKGNNVEENQQDEMIKSPEANENSGQEETSAENPIPDSEKFQAEAAEWKDKYLRLYAEFENFRTRSSREKMALISTATEGLMKELLPVMDDFERSLKAMDTAGDVDSLREGVQLVYHKFSGILQQKGLKAMEAIGQAFDADFHEAVTQIPAPSPEQKGLVIDEIEKGYSLHEKTIRFAKVIIGS